MNRKNTHDFNLKLDPEEKDLLGSLERGEWTTVPDIKKAKAKATLAATNYLRKIKEKRISIRVFAKDLALIKQLAEEEGLPYQTLVTSILHKYATGKLIDLRYSNAHT